MNREIKFKMPFDYWFSRIENGDLRIPITCKLSFINKLTTQEWAELIKYIFKKSQEAQQMWENNDS